MSLTHEYHELVEFVTHMNHSEETIKELHGCYCRMTGLEVPLTMQRMFTWERWLHEKLTIDDLRLVIEVLRRKIKAGKKTLACLKFTNLIGNTEFFTEDLAEARQMARLPKVDEGRASVLRATGRPIHHDKPPRTAAQVVADEEAFKAFREFGNSL